MTRIWIIVCLGLFCFKGGHATSSSGKLHDEIEIDPLDFGGSAVREGAERFHRYLEAASNTNNIAAPMIAPRLNERAMKRIRGPMDTIGACTTFEFAGGGGGRSYGNIDHNLVQGRLIWGQIQDFLARCASGQYDELWCVPVVRFIENGVVYRELELAMLETHKRHATVGSSSRSQESKKDADPDITTLEGYQQILRGFIDLQSKKK